MVRLLPAAEEEQVERHQCSSTQQGVRQHIDNHMRREPGALQGRHQVLAVNLGLEKIDADEDKRQHRGKSQNPFVTPAAVNQHTRQRQEKGIPQPRLALRPQRRTLQGQPESDNETSVNQQAQNRKAQGGQTAVPPGEERACSPASDGREGKPGEQIPTHRATSSFLGRGAMNRNRHKAPQSIIRMPASTKGCQGSRTSSRTLIRLSGPACAS